MNGRNGLGGKALLTRSERAHAKKMFSDGRPMQAVLEGTILDAIRNLNPRPADGSVFTACGVAEEGQAAIANMIAAMTVDAISGKGGLVAARSRGQILILAGALMQRLGMLDIERLVPALAGEAEAADAATADLNNNAPQGDSEHS